MDIVIGLVVCAVIFPPLVPVFLIYLTIAWLFGGLD